MRPWATTAVNMPWLSDDHVRTRKRGGERGESKCVLAQSFVFFTETVRHLFLRSVAITREVGKSPRGWRASLEQHNVVLKDATSTFELHCESPFPLPSETTLYRCRPLSHKTSHNNSLGGFSAYSCCLYLHSRLIYHRVLFFNVPVLFSLISG